MFKTITTVKVSFFCRRNIFRVVLSTRMKNKFTFLGHVWYNIHVSTFWVATSMCSVGCCARWKDGVIISRTVIYMERVESSDCPSSSESISSSGWLFLSTRKLSVPRTEATSRNRKTFRLLLSESGTYLITMTNFILSGDALLASSRFYSQKKLLKSYFTWDFCLSVPVKINVEVAKQHAVKTLNITTVRMKSWKEPVKSA